MHLIGTLVNLFGGIPQVPDYVQTSAKVVCLTSVEPDMPTNLASTRVSVLR